MKEMHTTLSEVDFEQLPPALRRKYFSSLERLRLAQDGAYPIYPARSAREPQRSLTCSSPSCSSKRHRFRRPSTTLDEYFPKSSPSSSNKLRKHSGQLSISAQKVADFALLPPALQRKQFSRAEQVLLASRVNRVIFDAADEALYKHYVRPSTSYQELYSQLPNILDTDREDMELSQDDLESLQWLDEEQEIDLSLHDYHAAVAETAQKSYTSFHASSQRRGLSITNLPFPRRTSSITSGSEPLAWPLPAASSPLRSPSKIPRAVQSAAPTGHRKNRISTSSLEPAAAHYQDPAARMKLRVYLASPQKFDEAIEFGFPSMQSSTIVQPTRPTTNPRSTESTRQLFLHDDTPSLSDGDDHDFETLDSPRTPEMAAFSIPFSKSKESSLDRTSIKPKVVRDFTEPYVHGLASNREMTLHMTLTRPDLRSPEEKSSTREINAQPLEQAPLHFSDDVASFWDSLPDEESKMKKLFRRLGLR